jgi:ubiquinone/menaquinone biosynthesis C-methylase UbiE
VTVFAVDRQRQIARIARDRTRSEPAIRVAVGDGFRLPFPSRSFDAVVSSMTLHHVEDDETAAFVSELGRVARHIVIVNDLERHRINYAGAKVLAHTVWRSDPYTRHDGPLSVRRSFTKWELLSIGRRAGLEDARVHRHFPYRLALVGRPAGAESA